jgi:hypothetical protein
MIGRTSASLLREGLLPQTPVQMALYQPQRACMTSARERRRDLSPWVEIAGTIWEQFGTIVKKKRGGNVV